MTETTASNLQAHLAHFRRRVIEDALIEATSAYWLRRAATFAAVGTAACDEIAQACRNHAHLVADLGLDDQAAAILDDIAGEITEGAVR